MTRDDSSACYDWFPQLLKKKKKGAGCWDSLKSAGGCETGYSIDLGRP